jgi:serine/threonine protein kinase
MPFTIKCPGCAAPLEVPDLLAGELGGSTLSCAECGAYFAFDYSGSELQGIKGAVKYAQRIRLAGYRLLGVLPPGGMGFLYSAVDLQRQRLAAIKVLPPEYLTHEPLVERFRREARAMRAVRHPGVIPIWESGDVPQPYIAMPFLAGRTLRSALGENGHLDLDEATAVFAPLSEALDYVHECGFLHRDVKPSNVFLTTKGQVVLFDFGISRELDSASDLTAFGTLGTPAYNAPELYEKSVTTAHSDQYSLAVLLYEMLTGHLPMGVFPNPRDFCHRLPEGSSEAILRALAHNPKDRHESVRRFAREFLRPLINITPAEAYRENLRRLAEQHADLLSGTPQLATGGEPEQGRTSGIGSLIARLTGGGRRN